MASAPLRARPFNVGVPAQAASPPVLHVVEPSTGLDLIAAEEAFVDGEAVFRVVGDRASEGSVFGGLVGGGEGVAFFEVDAQGLEIGEAGADLPARPRHPGYRRALVVGQPCKDVSGPLVPAPQPETRRFICQALG